MTATLLSPPRNAILTGDALEHLRTLPDSSIDSVVTSPPYFRLRDYGAEGQLGLESHIDTWADQLRDVLRECHRVLVPTGTLWLNLGDSYSTRRREGAARKSLLLGPERLAQLLVDDGWILRNKIVWAKPNTIPTSVRDRLATKHEAIYLLTKSPSYYFDLDSLREPHTSRPPRPRNAPTRPPGRPAWLGPSSDGDSGLAKLHAAGLRGHPLGKNPGDVWNIAVSRFRGAHFATYPEALARRMVLAGSPRMRCTICRKPWTRRLIREAVTCSPRSRRDRAAAATHEQNLAWSSIPSSAPAPRPSRPPSSAATGLASSSTLSSSTWPTSASAWRCSTRHQRNERR